MPVATLPVLGVPWRPSYTQKDMKKKEDFPFLSLPCGLSFPELVESWL